MARNQGPLANWSQYLAVRTGLLGAWDTDGGIYDITGGDPTGPDGVVGINDYLQLLAVWGPCL